MIVLSTFRGQPCAELSLPEGDRVRVALFGAHVLSWHTADGRERLYLSPEAIFDGRSPIRGGVPICFPQFNQRALGVTPLPKHGLARTSIWAMQPTSGDASADACVLTLRLQSDDATRAVWTADFVADFTVTLASGSLHLEFSVRNTGDAPWPMALALHTYLRVEDIAQAQLQGLAGLTYWDGVRDLRNLDARCVQPAGALAFTSETDRIYQSVQAPLTLTHTGGALRVEQAGSLLDVVVWSPGAALSASLPDMPDDGYRQMVCVEAARIQEPVTLQPGQAWGGWQRLRALD